LKHFLHDQHVYLAGPIEGLTVEQATGWRRQAKVYLNDLDIDVLDPTRRTSYINDKSEHAAARVWKADLQDISYSSVILANLSDDLPGKKWGTVAEIAHSHTKNKIIIVLLAENQWVHPFIANYATEIHRNLKSALFAVKEYYV
jgi:nucleoside 2-deoxyribosyltransferase